MTLSLLPLLLLVLVFLHHRWRVRTRHQNPWKGGGFGMFSDIHRTSVIPTLWIHDGGRELVPLRVEITEWMSKVNTVPSVGNMRAWADELMRRRWHRCGEYAHPISRHADIEAVVVARVTLRHLEIGFDGWTGIHSASEVQTFTLHAPASCTGHSRS